MENEMDKIVSEAMQSEMKVYTPMNKEEFDFLK